MKKILILLITIVTFLSCNNNSKEKLEGKWEITSKPRWVKRAYLAHKSDIYEFRKDGNCVFGTAGGTYEMLENSNIKVNFPIQKATPGYVGILNFKIENEKLTLSNSNEDKPIILKKVE